MSFSPIIEYLRLDWPTEELWRYSDDAEAIEWVDSGTVIFRSELAEVLSAIVPTGLPPFGLVVLLMSACSGPDSRLDKRKIFLLMEQLRQTSIPQSGLESCLSTSIVLLKKLANIDLIDEHRTEIKKEIARHVFEDFANHSESVVPAGDADRVIELLAGNVFPEELLSNSVSTKIISIASLEAFNIGLSTLDLEKLPYRMRTGLDQEFVIPDEAPDDLLDDVEPVESFDPLAFLQKLEDHSELGGLARLTRHLMSVFHFPQAVSEQEELPVGGVSDVINRGPLHRLLVSELANDDDVLLTRLALNEALYLRREKPPGTPNIKRKIFIDSGLRMWGMPRVYATAFALATGLQTGDIDELEILTSQSSTVQPVSLWTVETIQQQLEILEPELHPGEILDDLMNDSPKEPFELIVVSCQENLDDPGFQQALKESDIRECYLVSVERDGAVHLVHWNQQGQRVLKQAQLDLDRFLRPNPKSNASKPLFDSGHRRDLPAIFGLEQFPLRLSVSVAESTNLCIDDNRVVSLTSDGRIMLWTSPELGAIQLAATSPGKDKFRSSHFDRIRDQLHLLYFGKDTSLELVTIHLQNFKQQTATIRSTRGFNVVRFLDQHLLLVNAGARSASVIELETGQHVFDAGFPGQGYIRDPFRQPNSYLYAEIADGGMNIYYAVSVKQNRLHFEPVIDSSDPDFSEISVVFYSEATQCPVALLNDGRLKFIDGKGTSSSIRDRFPLMQTIEFFSRSDAGDRITIREGETSQLYDLTLPDLECTNRYESMSHYGTWQQEIPRTKTTERNLRKYLSFVSNDRDRLTLGIRRRRALELVYSDADDKLFFVKKRTFGGPKRDSEYRQFRTAEVQPPGNFKLYEAHWETGARVWFDRRGLLHLKSGQPGQPEVTLVTVDSEVSGWTSDGEFFGNEFFIHPHKSCSCRHIYDDIIRPFLSEMT